MSASAWVVTVTETTKDGVLVQPRFARRPYKEKAEQTENGNSNMQHLKLDRYMKDGQQKKHLSENTIQITAVTMAKEEKPSR